MASPDASPSPSCCEQTELCPEAWGPVALLKRWAQAALLGAETSPTPSSVRAASDSRDGTALHVSVASPGCLLAVLSLDHLPRSLLVLGTSLLCSPGAGGIWLLLPVTGARCKQWHSWAGKAARLDLCRSCGSASLVSRLPQGAGSAALCASNLRPAAPQPHGPPKPPKGAAVGTSAMCGAARAGLAPFSAVMLQCWWKQPALQ